MRPVIRELHGKNYHGKPRFFRGDGDRNERYYRGDGDDSHGITVGMGTTLTVLPWGWGRLAIILR